MTQATVAVLSLASAALTVESQQMDVGVSDCCRVLGCFLDLGEG